MLVEYIHNQISEYTIKHKAVIQAANHSAYHIESNARRWKAIHSAFRHTSVNNGRVCCDVKLGKI